jgi:hypothetical protein
VPVIDFANSYMTFFGKQAGNVARIQLDAACTLTDETSGVSEVFYLIAPCRAERMYLEAPLFQMPNYEFCGIFSNHDCVLIRTHWATEHDNREYGLNRGRFDDVHLDVRTFPSDRPLGDVAAIVAATLDNRPLVARTELRDPERKLAHAGRERADHVVGSERRAVAGSTRLSQRCTLLSAVAPPVQWRNAAA